jgi:hypothetical protein
MSIRTGIIALIAAASAATSASADVVTRDVALTNDTGVNWGSVLFYLLPPTALFDNTRFQPIKFVEDLQGFSVPMPNAGVTFPDAPRNDQVRFTFDANQSFLGNGQTLTFRLTVDDPTNYGFRIGYRTTTAPQPPVPTPGATMLGGLAVVVVGTRRRR